jgi:hypothetical protein
LAGCRGKERKNPIADKKKDDANNADPGATDEAPSQHKTSVSTGTKQEIQPGRATQKEIRAICVIFFLICDRILSFFASTGVSN